MKKYSEFLLNNDKFICLGMTPLRHLFMSQGGTTHLDRKAFSWRLQIALPDVYEGAGHTLVHFFYSGNYETILSPPDVDTCGIAGEYRRSILVYHASRKCEIPGLESLAKHYIEHFGKELALYDVLRLTRDVFSTLPEGETWLPNYIKSHLLRLKLENPNNNLAELYSTLGHDHQFDNTVMKMVVDMLSVNLSDNALRDDPAAGEPAADEPAADEPAADEPAADEPVADEPATEEPVADEPVADEPATEEPVEEWIIPDASSVEEKFAEYIVENFLLPLRASSVKTPQPTPTSLSSLQSSTPTGTRQPSGETDLSDSKKNALRILDITG
ncbi:hypothetical protein Pdw03_0826 [Penicillium digitatum]|uniref:BTB domain-containing protein n=1 Tax=Penicillium digitatum TaxID=36651 RepID=A0A7T6XRQ4_PENDI|nr:hypothetical protein Pdw03_0826 [Penicillium digitatum]